MAKLTTRQQALVHYDNVITKNKKQFKAGQRFTRDAFIRMFSLNLPSTGSYKIMHRANLKLVQVQNDVNLLMRESGLYLKSVDYYNEFVILEKEATKRVILRYQQKSEEASKSNSYLTASMGARIKAGTWGTYNKAGTKRISSIKQYEPSTAYTNQRNTLKHW